MRSVRRQASVSKANLGLLLCSSSPLASVPTTFPFNLIFYHTGSPANVGSCLVFSLHMQQLAVEIPIMHCPAGLLVKIDNPLLLE
jgi:hypothetical protein